MTTKRCLRLFLDSNVLIGGVVAAWGLDKAVLSLCAAGICRLVLAEAVRDEIEEAFLSHIDMLNARTTEQLIKDYRRLLRLARPECLPYPSKLEVNANRHLIRHAADVPIVLSAMASRPDWLLTHNTRHLTKTLALRTGLRIATPAEFFRRISETLR